MRATASIALLGCGLLLAACATPSAPPPSREATYDVLLRGGTVYDGSTEIALFPGDLPENPESVFEARTPVELNFLRFLPPQQLERNAAGEPVLPHIRFDSALEFLIGDKLR